MLGWHEWARLRHAQVSQLVWVALVDIAFERWAVLVRSSLFLVVSYPPSKRKRCTKTKKGNLFDSVKLWNPNLMELLLSFQNDWITLALMQGAASSSGQGVFSLGVVLECMFALLRHRRGGVASCACVLPACALQPPRKKRKGSRGAEPVNIALGAGTGSEHISDTSFHIPVPRPAGQNSL